jgi:hypothetical protein
LRTRLHAGSALGAIIGLLALGAAPAMASSAASSEVVLSVAPVPTAAHPKAGTPMVTWSTGNGSPGELTVMPAEAREILVAANAEGSVAAPWLVAGEVYVLRLYSTGSGRKLLARLTVGRQAAAEVIAPPQRPRITSSVVDRLLQILAYASVLALAVLAVLHVREVRRDG